MIKGKLLCNICYFMQISISGVVHIDINPVSIVRQPNSNNQKSETRIWPILAFWTYLAPKNQRILFSAISVCLRGIYDMKH